MSTAIERMTGIDIKSAYFSNAASLELFPKHPKPPHNNRVALLYGKNGSGKSSIAQGFREFRDSVAPRSVTLSLMDGTSSIDPPTAEKALKIFVFDEEYVSSRIKIKDSGLEAIVLLGDQVELDEQITETNQQIDEKRTEVSQHEEKYSIFINASDINSPDYWLTQIGNVLRKDDGWAGYGSKIKRLKHNLSVTNEEIDRIGIFIPSKTLTEAQREFNDRYMQFVSVGSTASTLTREVATISITDDIEERAAALLKKVVNRPELTQREQYLLELFNVPVITEARTFLSNPNNIVCDKCLQKISNEYRTDILKEIEFILNRDVEEFKNELEELLIVEVDISIYQDYRDLPLYSRVRECLDDYNNAIVAHNNAVQAKIKNPFEAREYDNSINLIAAYDASKQALAMLETNRLNFNRTINENTTVKNELLELNDTIAHYAIKDMYTSLHTQRNAKQAAYEHLGQLRANLDELEARKTQLDSQRKNFRIASDEIDRSLKYIFFCNGRLTLELGIDRLYHLKVNGNPVTPNKVSCGERNALALCYFFTEIAKNMNAKTAYSDEILLVIDDPVSSFDIENRIGILSFLRWKLEQILDGCATSKILVMTHDISVIFDMEKALGEISKYCENKSYNAEYKLFQLEDKLLSDFKYKKHNEYTQLLQRVHKYATSADIDPDSDLVIGNVMRRILEAFASFSYKKGIKDVSLDKNVLEILPDEESKLYYRNLMYRLVLDNESHFEENINGAPEMSFFSHLSQVEKQRTARDILCFIYRLNKPHILSHLPEAEPDLITWCEAVSNINKSIF